MPDSSDPFNGQTPPPGVPHLPLSVGDETGRISKQIDSALSHEFGPEYNPESLIEDLARRIAPKISEYSGGSGGKPPPTQPKGPFDMGKSDWAKILISIALGGALFLFTWYNTVNRDLDDRATKEEVKSYIKGGLETHSEHPHPPTEDRLKTLEQEQTTIRQSQIRAEGEDKVQTSILEDIKEDLIILKRRRR